MGRLAVPGFRLPELRLLELGLRLSVVGFPIQRGTGLCLGRSLRPLVKTRAFGMTPVSGRDWLAWSQCEERKILSKG